MNEDELREDNLNNSQMEENTQSDRKEKGKFQKIMKRISVRIRINRKTFFLLSILRCLVIATMIRCIVTKQYESVGICILAQLLFIMPAFAEENLDIEIPPLFEAIIYLFIYAAEILGEINHYYILIPGWDTMLHTMNGFLCAAVGFSMVDLLNQKSRRGKLSPGYLTMVAFCFSMTVGVLWEFFEFFMDWFFMFDMQKDYVVGRFASVTLDPDGMGTVIKVKDITDTVIHTASGKTYVVDGGYLDIGIIDTMKDLFVNFIGAVAFSVIGYLYVSNRSKKNFAEDLMIRKSTEEEKMLFSRMMDVKAKKDKDQLDRLMEIMEDLNMAMDATSIPKIGKMGERGFSTDEDFEKAAEELSEKVACEVKNPEKKKKKRKKKRKKKKIRKKDEK